MPFEYESQKSKFCRRSTISWLLSALVVCLLVIISVNFLYPVVERRFESEIDHIHIYEDQPIEVKVPPPVMTDYISEEVQRASAKKPWDFEFLIDPSHLCATRNPPNSEQYQRDPEVKLLMVVHSATDHFEQRNAIRKTWGCIAESPRGPMRLGFILGTTGNQTVANLIREESAEYTDIIQADFEDTYRQLTTKSVLMLKWVARRCPHAQYFLKADDDTFVNVGIIANILGSEPFVSQNKFIGGYVHSGAQPTRNPEEKYYVSEDDYSDEEYPPYTSGSAYVMTGPTAVELFLASKEVQPFVPMEDVFVTGLCGRRIDATLLHEPRFRYDDPPSPPSWSSFSSLASAHSVTPDSLELVWDEMTRTILDHFINQESAMNRTIFLRKRSIS